MPKKAAKKKVKAFLCHEVEFDDMDHTLVWLIDAVKRNSCTEAASHLKIVRQLIARKRSAIFH